MKLDLGDRSTDPASEETPADMPVSRPDPGEAIPHVNETRREDVLSLRSELLGVLTGDQTALSPAGRHTASGLSASEKAAVESDMRSQLTRYPSALQDACDVALLEVARSELYHLQTAQCRMIVGTGVLAFASRAGQVRGGAGDDGERRPWRYSISVQLMPFLNRTVEMLWSAASAPGRWQIVPKIRLRGTVLRSQSPLFRLFDGFVLSHYTDKDMYFHGPRPGPLDRRTHAITGEDSWAVMTWNMRSTARELEDMADSIRRLIDTGAASATDTDEYGNTLLHEICNLLLLLEQKHPEDYHHLELERSLSTQLEALIALILSYGVDPFESAAAPHHRPVHVRHLDSDVGPATAFGYYYAVKANVKSFPDRFSADEDAPGILVTRAAAKYDLSDAVGSLNVLKPDSWRPGDNTGPRKRHALQNHPETAEGLEYDALSMAILRRSYEKLTSLARPQKIPITEDAVVCKDLEHFDYLSLALGWEEGLLHLTRLGYEPTLAILDAIDHQDDSSLAILLSTDHALFAPRNITGLLSAGGQPQAELFGSKWLFEQLFYSPGCWPLLAQDLRRRRDALRDLAMKFLSPEERDRVGLTADSVLDVGAAGVGALLSLKTSIPPALDCYRMSPIYDMRWSWDGPDTLDRLDALLGAGFIYVEQPDENNQTQLSTFSRGLFGGREQIFDKGGCAHIIAWFLQHGASPALAPYVEDYDSDDPEDIPAQTILQYPSVLHTLAALASQDFTPHFMEDEPPRWTFDDGLKLCRPALEAAEVDYRVADECICFCSVRGCLPVHLVSPCGHINTRDINMEGSNRKGETKPARRVEFLEQLVQVLPLSASDRELWCEEGARLEIFERLGMAHTCCAGARHGADYWSDTTGPTTPSEQERRRMQDEDAELATTLEALMEQYRSLRSRWQEHGSCPVGTGSGAPDELWERWWRILDEILPPMTREEACRTHLWDKSEIEYEPAEYDRLKGRVADDRAKKEKEAMERNGYGGWGFMEVVQRHFEKEGRRIGVVSSQGPATADSQA